MCNVFINKVQLAFRNEEGIVSLCLNDDTTHIEFGLFVLLMLRTPVPESTQNGGICLICNLQRCEFCLIIISSSCFSLTDTVM